MTQRDIHERSPLLVPPDEPPVIVFDPEGDTDNPLEWQASYKYGIVLLLAVMAFTITFTCIGVTPVAEQIVRDLEGRDSKSASVLLVTIWELGEAAGPLLIAPLSEIYGRYPVYNVANVVFIIGTILAASSRTTDVFLFSRFLNGLAVASNVLGPAIIGDIFPSEQRGSGMSLIMLAPLAGGALGPLISGAIAETLGWRSVLWMSVILSVVCEIFFFTLFRETYKVTILKRRAARMRRQSRDDSLKCAWDERDDSLWSALRVSIARPAVVGWNSSVLQILSLYGGLVFSLFYVMATTLPAILRDAYGFSPAWIGTSFMSFTLGSVLAIVVCNSVLDRWYIKLGKQNKGCSQPEYRLPLMIGGSIILPAAVMLYGWTPDQRWPVGFSLLSVVLTGFAMITIMVPMSSYVVDAFGVYSASAMTMILIVRCLASTVVPLAVPPLVRALGLGFGFLIMAAAFLIMIPLPILVMRYGVRWRQNSIYTRDQE